MNEMLNRTLFTIGDTPVTIGSIAILLVALVGTYAVSRLVQRAIGRWLGARSGVDHGTAQTSLRLLHYAFMAVGLAVGLDTIGVNLAALFAAGAFAAVAVGFAMQNIMQNFVSGLILLVERTIKEGDILEVDQEIVRVERLGARATVARTRQDEQLIIPNSILIQSTVSNLTLADPLIRVRSIVGVSYASDVDQVFDVLRSTARAMEGRDPNRDVVIFLKEFGDSSIVFEISVWTRDPWRSLHLHSSLNHAIWRALKEAGITIAFPQLDLHVKEMPTPV